MSGQPSTSAPECYVIVYNVSKKHNIGTLLRSCTAFAVKEVCLVGSRHFNTFGCQGTSEHVPLRHFPTIEDCVRWLKEEAGCRVVGVEIDPSAVPVQTHPFNGNTAFMLGNEGQGLSPRQLALCDALAYIPQHGPGTASLNVTVAASIALHHWATWAGLPERGREGAKFHVTPPPTRTRPRGCVPPTAEEVRRLGEASEEGAAWMEELMAQGGGADGVLEALRSTCEDESAAGSAGA